MEFPVDDILDQAISKSVNSLVGNNDVNLNTLLKMATLNEMNPLEPEKIESVLSAIKRSNMMEHYWYEKEMSMNKLIEEEGKHKYNFLANHKFL